MRKKTRQWLIIACAVVALFIPTYIALISYAVINSMPEPVDAAGYEMSITSPRGEKIQIDEADRERIEELFLIMRRDAAPTESFSFDGGYTYSVELFGAEPGTYGFVFFSDAHGYMLEGERVYELPGKQIKKFIASKYAYDMYENSDIPRLLSNESRNILPYDAKWKYSAYGGGMVEASVPLRTRTVTYDHSGSLELSFSEKPNICNITVSSDAGVLYSGTLDGLAEADVDETLTLEYSIYAKWTGKDYQGEANYHFFAMIGKPAEFDIYEAKYENKYLEFIEVSGKNIGIVEDAVIIVTPSVGAEPRFFSDGAYVRSVIPFGNDTPEGKYKIFVSYGSTSKEFEIDYVKRTTSASENSLPEAELSEVEANREACLELIADVCRTNSETVYISGNFIDPEDSSSVYANSCSLLVGFGRLRYVKNTETGYKNDGVVYRTHGAVYVLNGGKVVKTGEDNWLGKYVVVDHGFGIKTWYCNLLSIDVGEGDTVKKSQAVGMAGNSGYTDKDSFGFYLMTTVNGVPISPYMLFENGVYGSKTAG